VKRKTFATTPRAFAIFKAECDRLVKLWGLNDWEVRVRHEDIGENLATCTPGIVSRICIIRLGTTWGPSDIPTDAAIKNAARHEVAHLATGELIALARARYVTDDEMTSAIETTAKRLERILPK